MVLFMDVWLNLQCCRWDLHCFWIQLKQNLKFISVFQPIPIRSNLRHLFALLVTVTILFRLLVYGGFLKCGSPHKSSILVGFSLLNYLYPPILGYPMTMETPISSCSNPTASSSGPLRPWPASSRPPCCGRSSPCYSQAHGWGELNGFLMILWFVNFINVW